MSENHSSRHGARSHWTTANTRTSLVRRNQKIGAKQISFHRNGDRLCQGVKLAVSSDRYKTFDRLLVELTTKLNLDGGAVRYVFDSRDGKAVTDMSELQSGISYVCSATNSFIPLQTGYGRLKHSWNASPSSSKSKEKQGKVLPEAPLPTPHSPRMIRSIRSAFLRNNRSKHPSAEAARPKTAKDVRFAPTDIEASNNVEKMQGSATADSLKAKLITVIKNSRAPQPRVAFVLNRKTAGSLEQVFDQLSAQGTLGKVKRLCTVDGTLVKSLNDLFQEDTHFIALSAHEKIPEHGIQWV